jgi:hypothetical protein
MLAQSAESTSATAGRARQHLDGGGGRGEHEPEAELTGLLREERERESQSCTAGGKIAGTTITYAGNLAHLCRFTRAAVGWELGLVGVCGAWLRSLALDPIKNPFVLSLHLDS